MVRDWLKVLRIEKNMTMRDVAHGARISESYYSQIENGKRSPSVNAAKAIGATLGFPWTRMFID